MSTQPVEVIGLYVLWTYYMLISAVPCIQNLQNTLNNSPRTWSVKIVRGGGGYKVQHYPAQQTHLY